MRQEALEIFKFTEGYYNNDFLAYPPNVLAAGSKNLMCVGSHQLRVFKGVKDTTLNAGRTMFHLPEGWGALEDNGATEGIGSVFSYIAESLFWIGGGLVNSNGTVLNDSVTTNDFTATSNLQLSPKDGSTWDRAYTAGMAQPSAPDLAAKDPGVSFTGLMSGLYSFKIARVRSDTGGRSIASAASAVVFCENQTVRLGSFPALDSNGQDKWAIFATKAGFGGTGVHWLVEEIDDTDLSTIDSVTRSYEIEFNDSDLLADKAWIDDLPPPSGSFAARLNDYIIVIGAHTNAIASSLRNFPESYHPDHLAFLPRTPTAILQDPQGNYLYISTASSVHILSVVPSAFENPMILQTIWNDTGVLHPHSWCNYEGTIFAYVAHQGAVAMNAIGEPSSDFALPVAKEMAAWDVADTKVFPVPELNSVLYTNNGKALMFNVQNLKWSSPLHIDDWESDEIVAGLVIDRRLHLSLDDGAGTFNLFKFDEQPVAGSTSWMAKSPEVEANPIGRINIYGMKAKFLAPQINTTNIRLYVDYVTSPTKTLAHTNTGASMQTTITDRLALYRKEAFSVAIEGTQSDFTKEAYPARVAVFGTYEGSNQIGPQA